MIKNPRMPSVMKHDFSKVPRAEIERSSFNRSHGYKTTLDAGDLVPIFLDEALPGDTFNLRMTGFARLGTPIVPIMDNMFMDTFFFAVPCRLVWDNWQKFNGEQTDPGDSTDFTIPQIAAPDTTGWATGSLADYFGIPIKVDDFTVNALPFRCYNLIWNEWFRDQNLQDSVVVDKDNGPDSATDYVILKRGKRHDYFTSCLPWPQKGTAVDIPLGTLAPVIGIGKGDQNWALTGQNVYETDNPVAVTYAIASSINPASSGSEFFVKGEADPGEPAIYADLSSATASTINSLREAFQLQRLFERDARGGTRYTEIIRAHFGVVSPDARLQRPEVLSTYSTPVAFTPIAQTSPTPGAASVGKTPQGNLAAVATASLMGHGFVKSFTEHCYVIGLVNVRADLNYQQGLNRLWSRSTRYDFYWPALAHLGEQAVLNKEIYLQGDDVTNVDGIIDNQVFGYQERFAEYRYKPSLITGQFRSTATTPLDIWHLAEKFTVLPELDDVFISAAPPVDRIIAVPTEPQFFFDAYFNYICARPMPTYSVPGLIDHF